MSQFALQMRQISKTYGSVRANRAVNFSLKKGTLHALAGENGAGKSTLMKILFGLESPDEGASEIVINDQKVNFHSPQEAIKMGVGMVQQHFALAEPLSALDNIIIGSEPTKGLFLDRNTAKEILMGVAGHSLDVPWAEPIEKLSVGFQQRVEILKLLFRKAEILILDEPTAVLTPHESEALFKLLIEMKNNGKSIVVITHKLPEIMSYCDEITVLRHGEVTGFFEVKNVSKADLVRAMIGRDLNPPPKEPVAVGKVLIETVNLSSNTDGRGSFKNISFQIKQGEVVGFAGVEGSGQQSVVDALLGINECSGKIEFNGETIKPNNHSRVKYNWGLISEDRHHQSVWLEGSLTENMTIGLTDRFSKFGILNKNEMNSFSEENFKPLKVKYGKLSDPIKSLSGGNQQKLVAAREIVGRKPEFLMACQPSRGVDVGAIESIHREILSVRKRGGCALLVSSDLEELCFLSDRIYVFFCGKIVACLEGPHFDVTQIGRGMTGAQNIMKHLIALLMGLAVCLGVSALVGENPLVVLNSLIFGAFGSSTNIGYTLFYATPLIFTGLSVALAFHGGLFNIGGEGQLYIGSLLLTAAALSFPGLTTPTSIVFATLMAFVGGAIWGSIIGWLKAYRGNHEVIVSIMLNFVSYSVCGFVLFNILKNVDSQNPESHPLSESYKMFGFGEISQQSPLNGTILLALLMTVVVWFLLYKTRWGFEIRLTGASLGTASRSGIPVKRRIIELMCVCGGLSGLVAVNEILGFSHKFRDQYSPGYGFMGIAVALLARNKPFGIILSALFFGALQKGALDLELDTQHITREMAGVLQALVILFVISESLWARSFRKRRTA